MMKKYHQKEIYKKTEKHKKLREILIEIKYLNLLEIKSILTFSLSVSKTIFMIILLS
jgi:hypothetical protein